MEITQQEIDQALDLIIKEKKMSICWLQRRRVIGMQRACSLAFELEKRGFVQFNFGKGWKIDWVKINT